MSLTLYYHPLSSFCWKALIALYETGAPFEPKILDFSDPEEDSAFRQRWPIRKFPLLHDDRTDTDYPEATIIIEYLAQVFPQAGLIPADPAAALEARLMDRLFDNYFNIQMQKVVGDRMRPENAKDPMGVDDAKRLIETAYGVIEARIEGRTWAAGESFTMADCSAAPGLFYSDKVMPMGDGFPNVSRYLARLKQRPSFARALKEAEPYFGLFPQE